MKKKSKLWGKIRNQHGSAVVEFIGTGLILLVPLFYIAIVVGAIQSSAIATQNAARAAARVFVESENLSQALQSARFQAEHALSNFGMSEYDYRIDYFCEMDPCFYPGSAVEVTVKVLVPLPLATSIFGLENILVSEVIGSAVYQIPRY